MPNWLSKIAVPLDADDLTDLHHPELRKIAPKNTQIYVYHGTSSKKLIRILQSGYIDSEVSGELKSYQSSSPGIFVALRSTNAKLYSWHSSSDEQEGDQSDEVVLMLQVPWKWIDFDPDDPPDPDKGYNQWQGRIWKDNYGNPIRIPANKIKMIGYNRSPEGEDWAWLTPAAFVRELKNRVRRGDQLSNEFMQLAGIPLGSLSRTKPHKDATQVFAESLSGWVLNYVGFTSGRDYVEKILAAIYRKQISPSMDAETVLPIVASIMGEHLDWKKFPKDYAPRPYESVWGFLRRSGSLLDSGI